MYSSSSDIGGFPVSGVNVSGGSGGAAGDVGFQISVLCLFSFDGSCSGRY